MPPSPAAPASPPTAKPAAPRLPVPRAALSALDQLRKQHPPVQTAALASTVITTALAEGPSVKTPPARYITRRLLSGASASAGASRLNYASTLAGLTRALSTSDPAADHLLAAVRALYGPNGSFDPSYPGAGRERALGALACVAAVVAGSTQPEPLLSASAARDAIALLRTCVDNDAARWRLGCAAVQIVRRLVAQVRETERDVAVKPIWAWCVDRREKEDGLQMAFMLREAALVSDSAFRTLYPSLQDGFSTALLDTFETGFSSLGTDSLGGEPAVKEGLAYSLPYGWRMAVKYVMTQEGALHLADLPTFWRTVVVDQLIDGSRSGEKKLLALELLPVVLEGLHDVETFDAVFGRSVASMIAVILGSRRGRVALRKGRTSGDVLKYMEQAANSLGKRMVDLIHAKPMEKDSCRPTLRAFLLWGARCGILKQLMALSTLLETLKLLSEQDATVLFSETIEQFSEPRNDGYGPGEREQICNSSVRPGLFRFVLAIARAHPFLAKDAVRAVTLYSVFRQKEDASFEGKDGVVEFDVFQPCSLRATYCGVLPTPSPPLSADVAAVGFRRLVDFLAESRIDKCVDTLPSFCLGIIIEVMTSNRSTLVTRSSSSTEEDDVGEDSTLIYDVAKEALEKVLKIPYVDKTAPLSLSLRIVTVFLSLYLHGPRSTEDAPAVPEAKDSRTSHLALFGRVRECADSLLDTAPKHMDTTARDLDHDEESPQPVEQISQLISELCGRDAAIFQRIALKAIEALTPCLDDRAVAVFFDAMDTCLLGNDDGESGEGEGLQNNMMQEDEEENTDEEDEAKGENDEDEGEDENDEDEGECHDEGHLDVGDVGSGNEQIEDTNGRGGQTDNVSEEGGENPDKMEEDESENEIDIDIDKEDPAVLAEFDKRLGAHLRLLKDDKRAVSRRKLKAEFRFTQVTRILDIIQGVARSLRIRLETSKALNGRIPLVFLDLHVRLYEFALGNGSVNLRFLRQICGIIEKQMLLPASIFVQTVSDERTVVEITDRFFAVLRDCQVDRKVSSPEDRTISRSAGCLLAATVALSTEGHERYLPIYQEMLDNMLKPGSHFWTPAVFSSFLQKAPRLCLKLLPTVLGVLQSEEVSKRLRSTASEMMLALSSGASQFGTAKSDDLQDVWESIRSTLVDQCKSSNPRKMWNTAGCANVMQVAATGIKAGRITAVDELKSMLYVWLQSVGVPRVERRRLKNMVDKVGYQEPRDNASKSAVCAVVTADANVTSRKRQKVR